MQPTANPAPEKLLIRARHGQFVVLAEDLVISLMLGTYGEVYELEWQFMQRFLHVSQVIADVGAHFGTFTVPFAKSAGPLGKVYAFEPQPAIHACLRETLALNHCSNVQLFHACVGASEGMLEIFEPDYNQSGNFGGVPFAEEGYTEAQFSKARIRVNCLTLDGVLKNSRLDFLKIDVEGMELDVLQGGSRNIGKHRPVIYLENNRPQKSPALINFLQALGYRMWWHTGAFYNPQNFAGNPENIYGVMHNINMICLPPGYAEDKVRGLKPVTGPGDHVKTPQGVIVSYPDP